MQTFMKAEEKCCKRLISLANQGRNCSPTSLPELAISPTALSSDRQTLAKFTRQFRTLPLPSVHSFPNPLPGIANPVRGAKDVHQVLKCLIRGPHMDCHSLDSFAPGADLSAFLRKLNSFPKKSTNAVSYFPSHCTVLPFHCHGGWTSIPTSFPPEHPTCGLHTSQLQVPLEAP